MEIDFSINTHDRLRELPNLRHGDINKHPIELAMEQEEDEKKKLDYYALSSIYGKGFAQMIKREYDIVKNAQCAYKSTQRPESMGLEFVTGDIDDLDFPDMFAPNGQRDDIDFDVHEVLENHFMNL